MLELLGAMHEFQFFNEYKIRIELPGKDCLRRNFVLAGHNLPEYKNNTGLKEMLKKRLGAMTGCSPH